MRLLFKLLGAILTAVISLFVANRIVEKKTGKGIAAHAYGWYTKSREDVLSWARREKHENVIGVTVWIDHRTSDVAHLVFKGKTATAEVEITESEVSMEEALAMFPELANQDSADASRMVLEA